MTYEDGSNTLFLLLSSLLHDEDEECRGCSFSIRHGVSLAKDEEGQKIYNVVSEKAVTANGDSLFDKRRAEVPKQLSDKEFELAKTLVRRYVDSHQDSYLPFDSYFQQYSGYKKGDVLMADVALFSSYKIVYQKGVAGITREDYRVKFKFLKDLGKERKSLTINLDKGVVVSE